MSSISVNLRPGILGHCIDQGIDCHMINVVPFCGERLTLFRQTGRTIITFSYSLILLSVFDLRRLITLGIFILLSLLLFVNDLQIFNLQIIPDKLVYYDISCSILLVLTSVFSRQWKTKKNTPCERK
jgi:phosphoglycerol transferase MdoB-like AlkP superfamily enzyme